MEDEPELNIESHDATDADFYVGADITAAQYIRTTDGKTGIGFAIQVWDFEKEEWTEISIAMATQEWLPHFLRELIEQVSCTELRETLLHTLDHHNH